MNTKMSNDYKKFFEFKQIEWKYLYTQKEWMKVKNGNIITRNKIMFYDWNKFVFDVSNVKFIYMLFEKLICGIERYCISTVL